MIEHAALRAPIVPWDRAKLAVGIDSDCVIVVDGMAFRAAPALVGEGVPQRLAVGLALDKRDLKCVQRDCRELIQYRSEDGEPPSEHELAAVRSFLFADSDT